MTSGNNARLTAWARRHPVAGLVFVLFASNIVASAFNIAYNQWLIIDRYATPAQAVAFSDVAIPIYNVIAYPFGVGGWLIYIWPLGRATADLLAKRPIEPERLARCRKRLVTLPTCQVLLNVMAWSPGAVFFPAVVCAVGGSENYRTLYFQFAISFLLSTALATAQTFFVVESYLLRVLYPVFFVDARPADVPGRWRIPFFNRLRLMWTAVALVPMLALLTVTWNSESTELMFFATGVFLIGGTTGYYIFQLVGRDMHGWIRAHADATGEVTHGNLEVILHAPRPDELGLLTDRFNDMLAALRVAERSRETFGQFVGAEVRDDLLKRNSGLDVAVKDVTVLFADIRGFTRRTAGRPPEETGQLLNRFLTLAFAAVEGQGGLVNKVLGDGVLALFGAMHFSEDQADRALAAACDLLRRIEELNCELAEPLRIGIGIHSGPALVGCFGATIVDAVTGRSRLRREFTAIGETVNVAQRVEQMTKSCGGPVLFSEATRSRLQTAIGAVCLGPQSAPGVPEPIVVHRIIHPCTSR